MEVDFDDENLDRLETEPGYTAGFPDPVVKAYRKRMQAIRAARDERDFYALKSWHFEKLKGKRTHQQSIRLNDQWRLIIELREAGAGKKVAIVSIEDYH